uniref:Uncharacterized protein n=1 Tax=Haptolina brevifila TaxID=156173 RepID=A0A7S2C0X6_9EUKA
MRALTNKPPLTEYQKNDVALASEWLEQTGEIHEELLPILWDQVGVRHDDYRKVTSILAKAGCIYLSENTQHGRRWVLPMRSVRASQDDGMGAWEEAKTADGVEVLRLFITLGLHQPAGLIESLLGWCGGLGQVVKVTDDGHGSDIAVHVAMEALPGVKDVLLQVRELAKPEGASEDDAAKGSGRYELSLEACGSKAERTTLWASLMSIKSLAMRHLDDFPGLANPIMGAGNAFFCCPGCASQKFADPTTWAIEDIEARAKVCEKCQESITLNTVTLGEFHGNPNPTILELNPHEAKELKFCGDKLRFGQPMEVNFALHTLLGLRDAEEVDRLRIGGEHAIIDEFIAWDAAQGGWETADADDLGWTDLDWLRYCAGNAAEVRFRESDSQYKPKEGGEEATTKAIAEKQERLAQQAKKEGVDIGRDSIDLNHFVKLPIAAAANLQRGHALALRLFTSRMGHKVNSALHFGCAPDRPHPYPATVILLNDAVWKLSAAQVEERHTLQRTHASLLEGARKAKDDGDDDEAARRMQQAKEVDAKYKSLECTTFWRSVFSCNPMEFKQRGCTEIGFMSVCKHKAAAKEHLRQIEMLRSGRSQDEENDEVYLPLAPGWNAHFASKDPGETQPKGKVPIEIPIHMFKILAMTDDIAPASLSFISTFPEEEEYVYAPGVFVVPGKISAEFMELGGENIQYKIVETVPALGNNLSVGKGAQKAKAGE